MATAHIEILVRKCKATKTNLCLLLNLVHSFITALRFISAIKFGFARSFRFQREISLHILRNIFSLRPFLHSDWKSKIIFSKAGTHADPRMRDKFFKRKALTTIVSAFIFLLSMTPAKMLANVIVTQPSASIGVCSGVFPTPYTTLGNIVITEGANGDFSAGTNVTLVLSAPANYEFLPGTGTVTFTPGQNISAAPIVVTATTITIT